MIRNYLGFPRGVTGRQLGRRGIIQRTRFGAALDMGRTWSGSNPATRTSCACPTAPSPPPRRDPGVRGVVPTPGCAVDRGPCCAGVFYGTAASQARDQALAAVVVGAGNSGGQAAVHLARHGVNVTLVARGPRCTTPCLPTSSPRSPTRGGSTCGTATDVVGGGGAGRLEWVELADRATGERRRIETAAMFVLIGADSRTAAAAVHRARRAGFRADGRDIDLARWSLSRPPFALETSVPGVFAGDLRANGSSEWRLLQARAVSVPMVHRYLGD